MSSGDMYAGVPSTPEAVRALSPTSRATPKSLRRTSPGAQRSQPEARSTLSGLTSRWTTPWAWA